MTAKVVTYRNDPTGRFCQLKLASGERILITVAQTGLRVSRLRFAVVPTETLLDVGPEDFETFMTLFGPESLTDETLERFVQVPVLDHVVAALSKCRSIDEVLQRVDRRRLTA